MKILLLGSRGMLGTDCQKVLEREFQIVSPEKKELDIVSWDRVIDKLHHTAVQLILNCAAFTDVDGCENHRDAYTVRKINVEGPRNLAQAAARFDCKMIHISSDYVFSGQKGVPQPYFEDDTLEPISAYGRSKMESEMAVRDNASTYAIVRTGWLYGIGGNNFIKSILSAALNQKGRKSLKMVDDQFGSPTWTYRLAQQIREMIKADARGTFHATSEGYCSRLECAEFVFNKIGIRVSLHPISLEDYPQKARRPVNCILENRLLKKQGLNVMADWKEDLSTFLDQFGEQLIKEAKAGTSGKS